MKVDLEDGLIRGQVFIVFGEDYQRHPHALEHVLRPLFGLNKFIWVETIGLRSPKFNLYDLKRILEKLKKMFSKSEVKAEARDLPENFYILSPFMIPFNQFSLIRKLNEWSVKRAVNKLVTLDIRPVSITSVPNACDYMGKFNEVFKLYYCVDEFSLWPGLDFQLVKKMEDKLLKQVDMIVATSDSLAKSKRVNSQPTQVITHGVDFDFFHIPALEKKNIPTKLCYFGLFDERFDQELLLGFLKLKGDVEVHIIGNVVCSIDRLKLHQNVIFHGKVDYKILPQVISSMDIFILPYVISELTNNINPLKLKEYLAIGRPVVATKLPEIVKLSDYLNLIENAQHLVDIVVAYEDDQLDHPRDKIVNYVRDYETWLAKGQQLCQLMAKRFVIQSLKE